MRVTHVITRLIVGGAQENTIASVLGLREKPNVTVDLISGPTTGPEGSLEPLVLKFPSLLTIVPELVRPISPLNDWIACRKLVDIFRRHKPDIVHTHSGKAGILGRLAASRARVPIIVHGIHGPSFGPFQGSAANFMFRTAERVAGKRTTHFVSVADAMTQQYLRAGIGKPENYTRIFSGFPLEPFLASSNSPQVRARWGLKPDDFVIGKVARLFRLKGHDDLLDVASSIIQTHPQTRFLLVGGGEWMDRFKDKARSLRLERHFIFTGLVPPTVIPELIGIMDTLVHLSRREGLPRILPQALAASRPIVAYDCDGAREVCIDGETGFLVPPGNLAILRDRLSQLIESKELRDRFGYRGRELVRKWFPVEKLVDDQYDLYRRLMARELPI